MRTTKLGGNLICGIDGCTKELRPENGAAEREHIRIHYEPERANKQKGGKRTRGKGKQKAQPPRTYRCRVARCRQTHVEFLIEGIVRHMEQAHIGWEYMCPAAECFGGTGGKAYTRWEGLRNHVTVAQKNGLHTSSEPIVPTR